MDRPSVDWIILINMHEWWQLTLFIMLTQMLIISLRNGCHQLSWHPLSPFLTSPHLKLLLHPVTNFYPLLTSSTGLALFIWSCVLVHMCFVMWSVITYYSCRTTCTCTCRGQKRAWGIRYNQHFFFETGSLGVSNNANQIVPKAQRLFSLCHAKQWR